MSSDPSSAGRVRVFVGAAAALLIATVLLIGCGTSRNCGDYDLENGQYVYDPNDGEYDRVDGQYRYVGCRSGNRSGVIFGGGGGNDRSDSSNRSGTDHRGGGPGWGK
jgi:major membrane immunogen (membrane-anchored lipoprotein)